MDEKVTIELSCQLDSLSCIIIEGRLPEYPNALGNLIARLNRYDLNQLNAVFQEFKDLGYKIHPTIQGILATSIACKAYDEVSALKEYEWTPGGKYI